MLFTNSVNTHHSVDYHATGYHNATKSFSYRPQSQRLTQDGRHPFFSGIKRLFGTLFGSGSGSSTVHPISYADNGQHSVYPARPLASMNLYEYLRTCNRQPYQSPFSGQWKQATSQYAPTQCGAYEPQHPYRAPAQKTQYAPPQTAPRAYLEPGALQHLTRHAEIDDTRIEHDPVQSAYDAKVDKAISRITTQPGFAEAMEKGLKEAAGSAWTVFVSEYRKTDNATTHQIQMRASLLGHALPPRQNNLDEPVGKPTVEDFVDSHAAALYNGLKAQVRDMIKSDPSLADFHGEKESKFLAARILYEEGLSTRALKTELAARLRARKDAPARLYPLM